MYFKNGWQILRISNIQKLRKEKRLSQTELAYLLDVPSQSKISDWENGRVVPNMLEAQKLTQIFGVSIDYLLGDG
jgi:transcriptional regulator with XRE-family HTH domain